MDSQDEQAQSPFTLGEIGRAIETRRAMGLSDPIDWVDPRAADTRTDEEISREARLRAGYRPEPPTLVDVRFGTMPTIPEEEAIPGVGDQERQEDWAARPVLGQRRRPQIGERDAEPLWVPILTFCTAWGFVFIYAVLDAVELGRRHWGSIQKVLLVLLFGLMVIQLSLQATMIAIMKREINDVVPLLDQASEALQLCKSAMEHGRLLCEACPTPFAPPTYPTTLTGYGNVMNWLWSLPDYAAQVVVSMLLLIQPSLVTLILYWVCSWYLKFDKLLTAILSGLVLRLIVGRVARTEIVGDTKTTDVEDGQVREKIEKGYTRTYFDWLNFLVGIPSKVFQTEATVGARQGLVDWLQWLAGYVAGVRVGSAARRGRRPVPEAAMINASHLPSGFVLSGKSLAAIHFDGFYAVLARTKTGMFITSAHLFNGNAYVAKEKYEEFSSEWAPSDKAFTVTIARDGQFVDWRVSGLHFHVPDTVELIFEGGNVPDMATIPVGVWDPKYRSLITVWTDKNGFVQPCGTATMYESRFSCSYQPRSGGLYIQDGKAVFQHSGHEGGKNLHYPIPIPGGHYKPTPKIDASARVDSFPEAVEPSPPPTKARVNRPDRLTKEEYEQFARTKGQTAADQLQAISDQEDARAQQREQKYGVRDGPEATGVVAGDQLPPTTSIEKAPRETTQMLSVAQAIEQMQERKRLQASVPPPAPITSEIASQLPYENIYHLPISISEKISAALLRYQKENNLPHQNIKILREFMEKVDPSDWYGLMQNFYQSEIGRQYGQPMATPPLAIAESEVAQDTTTQQSAQSGKQAQSKSRSKKQKKPEPGPNDPLDPYGKGRLWDDLTPEQKMNKLQRQMDYLNKQKVKSGSTATQKSMPESQVSSPNMELASQSTDSPTQKTSVPSKEVLASSLTPESVGAAMVSAMVAVLSAPKTAPGDSTN